MKFEGKDSLPPYLRRTAVPEGTVENTARIRVKKMYDEQQEVLQNHIRAGIDPTNENYKDTLERVNLLGRALNEGSYEHIDIEPPINEKARAVRLRLTALDRRNEYRDQLKVLEAEPVKNVEGIAECMEALERIEKQLTALKKIIGDIQDEEDEDKKHRIKPAQLSPRKPRTPEPTAPPIPQPLTPGGFDAGPFLKNIKREK